MSRKTNTSNRKNTKARSKSLPRRRENRISRTTLEEARELIDDGEAEAALELLEPLAASAKDAPQAVLRMLLDAYHQQRDWYPYCKITTRLVQMQPDDVMVRTMHAGALLAAGRPVEALAAFEAVQSTWPKDPFDIGIDAELKRLKPIVRQLVAESPFSIHHREELTILHEHSLSAIQNRDFETAIEVNRQLAARQPDFIPASNNLADALARSGQLTQATEVIREVIQSNPSNLYARANLVRYFVLAGQTDRADQAAQQMIELTTGNRLAKGMLDAVTRSLEALSLLGRDEAVIELFSSAERAGVFHASSPIGALAHHFVAVA